jgi:hypothetical protein
MEAAMETTILARVGAKPISSSEDLEILYRCLDEQQTFTGQSFSGAHRSRGQVQLRFAIDCNAARKCEPYFRMEEAAFLGSQKVTVQVDR